jgi:uracil-DNA glycosylase
MAKRIPVSENLIVLLERVRACNICDGLPLGPLPILQAGTAAKILIVGQAPGRKTHAKGRPFDDVSGVRLREWLNVDESTFYDPDQFAMLPMGFCFPGTGKGGDLPPREECAANWRAPLLERLPHIELTLVIGQYAQAWHLGDRCGRTLTETVANWQSFWPAMLPMPHPSPRNNRWLRQNGFFEAEVVPALQDRVRSLIGSDSRDC